MTLENLFAPVCSRQSFLETSGGGEALRRLADGLGAREPFLLLTGGPGIGKTALACEAVARWGSRVTAAFVAYPALSGAELLEEIIRRFGAEPPDSASRSKLLACIERALADVTSRGQVAVLVVDDAHDLSPELLEELRLLVNTAQQVGTSLEVLLIGLPTLEAKLDQPALASLRQRVSMHAKLEPLSAAETRRYLQHRATVAGGDGPGLFPKRTCRDIAARTRGVPRQINSLAAEALRVARVWGDQTVGADHVQTAAAALGGLAPAGNVEDSADDGAEDSLAPVAPQRPLTTARAAVVAPTPAPDAAPTRAAAPTPAPDAAPTRAAAALPTQTRTVAPAGAVAAASAPAATPNPTPPANQDAREWVARFVGDKGPLQISSRAVAETSWAPEALEARAAESPGPTGTPLMRPDGRSRPGLPMLGRYRFDVRMATTVSLAAIVGVTAIALLMRAVGLARNRAGQVAGVTTTTAAPQDTDKASSSGAPRTGSRTLAPPPAARVGEHRVDDSTTKSRGPFTLDVGGYDDLETALDQRRRMQVLTGFEGWVVNATDGGGKPYRIVLGAYRNHARAAAAGNMLMRSRTLRNVTVVPLPPRTVRR